MKLRNGFVSNSSTTSFIVDLEEYENTIALARKMLKVMIEDEDGNLEEYDIERFEALLNQLNDAEEAGLDANSPIMFPTTNFETFIMKKDDGYHVDTDFGFDWEDFMEGIGEMNFEPEFDLYKENVPFYIIEHDIMGKFKEVYADNTPCKTKEHDAWYEGVEIETGEFICLECEKDKIKQFKITKPKE